MSGFLLAEGEGLASLIPFESSLQTKALECFAFLIFFCLFPKSNEFETLQTEKAQHFVSGFLLAEGEGFEPPVPRGTTVFKTAAFDHSANPL